ncbi:hypothetical protein MAPG_05629 [Magnaporthiopsis poae ATCC 64411]|uniref:GDS1 winged helix domain-containing protein n=1 Tax=Magnaporthiopsis poae (strain ATCC 64411 / 73-15) TaxID=644358 RepID=A0A0C4DZW8_MAGP6|nr:hypothetical protein MAPG_05629 [Magnaporthiopsis poae ATCC 64411]
MSAGYNTRKVSLSLPSLGIALPGNHHAARRNPPSTATSTTAAPARPATATSPKSQSTNKKRKASHDGESQSPRPASQPRKLAPPRPQASKLERTPPPSPTTSVEMMDRDVVEPKPIDLESINDDIVEAVIRVLISQGNRPHLVKELATILMLQLRIVQQSANPCAIISSRLATFLKRPCWTASSPCPLAKELETVHPRRTYFYLTTCPHPPFSDSTVGTPMIKRSSIVTPSLSSGTSASEDADDLERRRVLSPSPEVDLSAPEFDDLDDDLPMPRTPIGSFSGRFPTAIFHHNRHHHHRHHPHSRHHRSGSPPLEKDEKEFTQTANVLQQKRKATGHFVASVPTESLVDMPYNSRDENLFGGLQPKTLSPTAGHHIINFSIASPSMRPSFGGSLKRDAEADGWARLDSMLEWDRSPENVELDELDGLLVDF